MPTYCYTHLESGDPMDIFMSIAEMERKENERGEITVGGEVFARDIAREHSGFTKSDAGWPMKCDAMGVHPSQINDERKRAEGLGTRIDFAPDGRAIFESRSHRKEYCRAMGYHDRNGGYGDP